jgi:hypothetical protein
MLAIEAASVVGGSVDGSGNLILQKQNGAAINAGHVVGPQGIQGPAGADAAPGSVSPTANTTPIRDSTGHVKTAAPSAADDAVTKTYADALVASVELGASVDLNTMKTAGVFTQAQSAEATTALNYPTTLAGFLEVIVASPTMVWQRYTPYGLYGKHIYQRALYSTTWYPWVLVGSAALPDPVTVSNTTQVSITSTTPALVSGMTITFVADADVWVDLRAKTWMVASVGETRASVVLAGATVAGWPLVMHGNTFYLSATDSTVAVQRSMSQSYKLLKGTTTVTLEAYQSSGGSHQVSYPVLEVVPLRWA